MKLWPPCSEIMEFLTSSYRIVQLTSVKCCTVIKDDNRDILIFFLVGFYLFGGLRCFQHCIGHVTMGSWKGRGNQYIQLVKVLYCKLPANGKQLPAFPLYTVPGTEPRPQRWEARVLPLCHRGPFFPRWNSNTSTAMAILK